MGLKYRFRRWIFSIQQKLKSDQDGIEMPIVNKLALLAYLLKSDQDGIEISNHRFYLCLCNKVKHGLR